MSKRDALKAVIQNLSDDDFAEIFRWISEKDWDRWDKELEADSKAGRLDFLEREARIKNSRDEIQ